MMKNAIQKIAAGVITIFIYFPLAIVASVCDTTSHHIDEILRKLRGA
jgi:hypothetical protein